MTLIVAISCKDGVVIACDSASSDVEIGIKQPCDKIKRIGTLPILFGGSGDVGLLQKFDECLTPLSLKPTLKKTRQDIKALVIPELKQSAELHVPYPQQGFHQPPIAVLLFTGIHNRKPWILEIERDGRDTLYDEALGDFAAIGSGKPWAQAVFRPHLMTPRDLNLGKIFAFRVLEDSINLAAAFLSKPIFMYTITLDGIVTKVDDDELKRLGLTCETWRELEREAVGSLLAPKSEPVCVEAIPRP